jgi:PTS system mannose-specific IIA component
VIGIVVAAHGDLAQALVTTAHSVVRVIGNVRAVGITGEDDTGSYSERLSAAVEETQDGDGVLLLTDMFGGTPSSVGLSLHRAGEVEVMTGANLPMLIKAIQLAEKETDLVTCARQVKEYGIRAISVASDVLGGQDGGGDGI